MKRLLHKLAHAVGWNTGTVEVWWQGPRLMVGFRCGGCGALGHVHESQTTARTTAQPVDQRADAQTLGGQQ